MTVLELLIAIAPILLALTAALLAAVALLQPAQAWRGPPNIEIKLRGVSPASIGAFPAVQFQLLIPA